MKYQLIQHLKTKSKVLTVYDTIADCRLFTKQATVTFVGMNYVGNFPIYNDDRGKVYTIQGLNERFGIVCSIPKEELHALLL